MESFQLSAWSTAYEKRGLLENYVNIFDNKGWLPLYYAARKGCLVTVTSLIEAGADINISNKGVSAIGLAAFFNHWNIVKLLAVKKANVNIVDDSGWTPLYYVARSGPAEIVKILVDSGADVNFKNNGLSAIDLAASNARWEVVQILIHLGACVDIENENKWTPLYYAAREGSVEATEALIRAGANININNGNVSPVEVAEVSNQWDVVRILHGAGAKKRKIELKKEIPVYNLNDTFLLNSKIYWKCWNDVKLILKSKAFMQRNEKKNNHYDNLLRQAVKNCPVEIIQAFIDAGADIHGELLYLATSHENWDVVKFLLRSGVIKRKEEYNSPLLNAVKSCPVEIMRAFMDAGADIHFMNERLLCLATRHENWDVAKFLLRSGIFVKRNFEIAYDNPLLNAVKRCCVEIMSAFIDAGANINFMNGYLLYLASKHKNWAVVKFLLRSGGFIKRNIVDDALCTAVESCPVEIMHTFVDAGADIHFMNGKILLLGSRYRNWNAVMFLLNAGVNVNVSDLKNNTPLHYAAEAGVVDVILAMIKAGAFLDVPDQKGRTPLEISTLKSDFTCSKLFIKYLVLFSLYPIKIEFNNRLELQYLCECRKQIEVMKHLYFANTKITFLDILLTKIENKLAIHFSDENINFKEEMKKTQLKINPYFADIEEKFNKIRNKVYIIKKSQEVLNHFFPRKLPQEIIRKILGFLNNHDLDELITIYIRQ